MSASLAAGIPFGVLWWLLTPLPVLEKQAGGVVVIVGRAAETAIAADGWFTVLALIAGIGAAGFWSLRLPDARLGTLVGLAVGGVVGSVVAWRLGEALGPAAIPVVSRGVEEGARFDGPLELSALGVLLAWPTSSVIAYFAAVAGLETARQTRPRRAVRRRTPHPGDVSAGPEQPGPQ